MASIDLANVEPRKNRHGRIVHYVYRKRERIDGKRVTKRVRLPGKLGSPEFMAAYAELVEADKASKRPARRTPFSFDELIARYRASSLFRNLAPKSQHEYGRCLDYFSAEMGPYDCRSLTRGHVIEMREANAHRPRQAEYFVMVLGVLMGFAVDLEWRPDNPAARIKKIKRAKRKYEAWSAEFINAMLDIAPAPLRTAILLGLAIGPRPSDLVALRWDQYDGQGIDYVQAKTGGEAYGPLLPSMRAILDALRAHARAETIVECDIRGVPLSYSALQQRFNRFRAQTAELAYTPKGDRYTLHGLRSNATGALFEAGLTNAQIKTITGHETDQMVAHYGRGARRKLVALEGLARVIAHRGAAE